VPLGNPDSLGMGVRIVDDLRAFLLYHCSPDSSDPHVSEQLRGGGPGNLASVPTRVADSDAIEVAVLVDFGDKSEPAVSQFLGLVETNLGYLLFGLARQRLLKHGVDRFQHGALSKDVGFGPPTDADLASQCVV
jgi:hypothetical protein